MLTLLIFTRLKKGYNTFTAGENSLWNAIRWHAYPSNMQAFKLYIHPFCVVPSSFNLAKVWPVDEEKRVHLNSILEE